MAGLPGSLCEDRPCRREPALVRRDGDRFSLAAPPQPRTRSEAALGGPRPHCLAELGGVCFLSPSVRRSLLLLATCLLWLLLCGRALRSPGVRARPPPRPPPHGKPEAGCPPRRHLPPRAFGGDQGREARSFEEPR